MRAGRMKPMIRYRFKDDMGFVTYKTFATDREARLWYDRNKLSYGLRELHSVDFVYKSKMQDSTLTI